jgi:hypothetical protein
VNINKMYLSLKLSCIVSSLPANRHLVGGQSSSLVGTDYRCATQSLDGRQATNNSVLLGHSSGTQSQASGDDSGQTFWNGSDGESYGNLEIVNGALNP